MKKHFKNFLITIVFLTIGIFVSVNQVYAETEVSGNISSDTTWTLANSPYVVTGVVYVLNGVKLTIEPGVVARFNKSTGLVINGEIHAVGDSNNLITFTTSELNPNKLYKISSDWYWGGVHIGAYASDAIYDNSNNYLSGNIIKYCVIEYASVGLSDDNNSPLFIDNNIIRYNNWGINSYTQSVISNNIIDSNATYGIKIDNGAPIIFRNQIINNSIEASSYSDFDVWGMAALSYSGGNGQVYNNLIKNNARGFSFSSSASPEIEYNNIYDNQSRNILMQQSESIQIKYNYLGSSNISVIDSTIQDGYSNTGVHKIFYEPYGLAELKFDGTDTFSQPAACSSWAYSDWTSCSNNNQQTRTVISSSPSGCVGGSPILTQSCTYTPSVCTSWAYSNWGTCTNGQQTRTIISSSPANCGGGNPILNQSCTIQPSDCTSWTYSDWSACQSNGTKTRTIVSSSPSSCSNGNPILIQSCTYIAPVCTSWIYSDWSICSNGQQTRTIISSLPTGCAGGISNITRSCTVDTPNNENQQEQICSSFTYSSWSNCSKDNIQLRSALSGLPSNCSGGQPTLSQTCIYVADKIDTSQVDVIKTNNEEKSTEVSVVVAEVINREQSLVIKKDTQLTNRLKGKILLQVESKGEAWYVSPSDGKKIYMANGDEAYQIMRNEGIGISNKDLGKINTDKAFAKKNNGKIFLQVEARGEAYYIDFDGVAHYLKDGAAAYEVMRSLGLGISNKDIRKIEVNS